MYICKICKKEYKNKRSLSTHLNKFHNMDILKYFVEYENFKIPKCNCGKNRKENKYKRLHFYVTCSSKECLHRMRSNIMSRPEVKKKCSIARLRYMKEHPEDTAWRQRNKPSYPEQLFINEIKKRKLNLKYNIVREKSFFPYYIDFAFENINLAIEIDGDQHNQKDRKLTDNKKDLLLKKNNWKIFRIPAINIINNTDKSFDELLKFIEKTDIKYKNCQIFEKILKERDIKEIKRKKNKIIKLIKKKEEKQKLIDKRLSDLNSIDLMEYGWVSKISKKWNVSHTQVKRFIKKNYNNLQYFER